MPQVNTHLKQAEFNEKIAEIAAQSKHHDWAVTMYFYAALHYVEAYAAHHGDNIYELHKERKTQHDRRLAYIQDINYRETGGYESFAEYERLFEASKKARYLQDIKTTARKHFFNDLNQYSNGLSIIKELVKIV